MSPDLQARPPWDILGIYIPAGPMITTIQKWGNSQGLRVSKELLSDARLSVGDAVEIRAHDGAIMITPVTRVRGGRDLAAMVRRIPRGYKPAELEWGAPKGREVW